MKLEEIDIRGKKIITERMILRPFEETDLNDFYEYACVDGVGEAAGWTHHKNIEETRRILEMFITERRTFAITDKTSGKVIGSLGIEASGEAFNGQFGNKNINELGYVLSKDYWGAGLMPEAVKAAIKFLFETFNLDAVTCGHFIQNNRSRRVIEKCEFKFFAKSTYKTRYDAVFESIEYILTREQYEKNSKNAQ